MSSYKAVGESGQTLRFPWTPLANYRRSGNLRAIDAALACLVLFGVLSIPVFGQPGGFVGVARDSASGKPLAEAHISARNLDTGMDQTTVTGIDGTSRSPTLSLGSMKLPQIRTDFRKRRRVSQ
jgi:hypothetical protein